MKKHLVIRFILLIALAVVVAACSAPATPTPAPRPTQPPTPPPPPTAPPTVPPTPVLPTLPPTLAATATSSVPSPTPPPPTRTPVPATRKPAATATAPKPPEPKGSIAYHVNVDGVDSLNVFSLDRTVVTQLVQTGPVMDISLSTNAHMGEWSPDNTKFAYVVTSGIGASNILRVLDFASGTSRALFSGEPGGGLSSPTWSPDGSRIAFIRMRGNQTFWAVDMINADGSGPTDLKTNTQAEQYRGGISWGKQGLLALAQNSGSPSDVYSMFADGGGLTNVSKDPKFEDTTPAWSPDGKLIAFTTNRDGPQHIYVMNADGTSVRRVSQGNFNDVSPAWSPDGNWIAFASFRGGSTDVYVMDTRGGNVRKITSGGGDHPVWSR
jgi:Tol biopolymer transport system component